jgi:hypothetical protein
MAEQVKSQMHPKWYSLQMQDLFKEQTRVFTKLLDKDKNKKIQQLLPLIHGIKSSADAIRTLRRERLLNEAFVLTRLLVERVINLCFLAVAEPADIESISSENVPRDSANAEIKSAKDLIERSKQFTFEEKYDTQTLEKKLAVLSSRTKAKMDVFRLAIATHYPQASAAMSGSIFGAVFHLKAMKIEEIEAHFQNEFAVLFFTNSSLLHQAISVIAEKYEFAELATESDLVMDKINEMISRMIKGDKPLDTEGYWKILGEMENTAKTHFGEELSRYERAFCLCSEAGVQAPRLERKEHNTPPLKLSALFLKRLLNDLRCIWLLINSGYTSQAASIAASLFEISLVIKLIGNNGERAKKFDGCSLEDELPWTIKGMCQEAAKDTLAGGETTLSYDEIWKLDYSQYRWLCEIKHTTLRVALHDAGATAFGEGFGVMAAPDGRKEYLGMKKLICVIVLIATRCAINAFVNGAGVKSESEDKKRFEAKMKELNDFLDAEVVDKASLSIPFGLQDTKWGKANLRPLQCFKK